VFPLKKGPTITIDLEGDSEHQGGGLTGETGTTRGVAEAGAVQSKGKGKHIVTTVEKGIQITEAKEKMMKPNWKH
jgi:hypothetical protein